MFIINIGGKYTKNKFLCKVFIFFLIIILFSSSVNCVSIDNIKYIKSNEEENKLNFSNINSNIKIRNVGGEWTDSLNTKTGSIVEIKIDADIEIDYKVIAILIELPEIDESPMFSYIEGTASPKPIFPIGDWQANDTQITWSWYLVSSAWSKEMSFKAIVQKSGSKSIDLTVIAVKDMNGNYDEIHDSVDIIVERSRPRFFQNFGIHLDFLKIFNRLLKNWA